MVLKKQTVWLLTMLSLIIVLSVYYVTTPTKAPTASKMTQNAGVKSQTSATSSTASATDNVFASYKLNRDQQASAEAQKYLQVIASDKSSATQVSKATDQLNALNNQSKVETVLEQEIISKGYGKDAVVTKDGSYAQVYVKAKSLSSKQASEIMSMVIHSTLGVQFANVKFQTTNS